MTPTTLLGRPLIGTALLAVVALCPVRAAAQPGPGSAAPSEVAPAVNPDLLAKVSSYFTATTDRGRDRIARELDRDKTVTLDEVAAAIRAVQLWEPRPPGIESLDVQLGERRADRLPVQVRVPATYDISRRWPLIVLLPADDRDADTALYYLLEQLGERAGEFLVATPARCPRVWLGGSEDDAAELADILQALKERYRLDVDRVHLVGEQRGGHAAFVGAALNPDDIAGAIAIDGTLAVQGPSAAVDLLLPNLHDTPVLAVFAADPGVPPAATGTVAAWNRYVAVAATQLGLPIRLIERSPARHAASRLPADALWSILATRRPAGPKRVDLCYRYPVQGRTGWLRLDESQNEPWQAQQIIVMPAENEDPSSAIRAVLESKLLRLSGTVDGQTVRIDTVGADRIEVLLNADLVDLDSAVKIYVNGTVRFDKKLTPRASTMLALAWADWDFERLWPTRLRIGRKGRAIEQ